MQKIVDLWAIIWPILKQVFEAMHLGEKVILFFVYFLLYIGLVQILITLIPRENKGRFLDRIIFPLIRIYLLFIPLIVVYNIFKEEHPILAELVSFIANFLNLDDLIKVVISSVVIVVVLYAIGSFFWHLVSLAFQWFFGGIPVLGPILERLIIGMEVLAIMATVMVAPVYGISHFQENDPYPIILTDPIVIPPGVDEKVWGVIETGVRKAQANGTECSAYLLYSLKIYETGKHFCDESWESESRPNSCASSAGALGMWQFLPETFQRNAKRHNIEGSLWNPEIAAEVACYFIDDEVKISLQQSRDVFIEEFASIGFVWNMDPIGAGVVYDRALELRKSAIENEKDNPPPSFPSGYIWPGPEGSFLWYEWGVPMWYGSYHNGIDIAMPGLPVFEVYAIANGKARYYYPDDCNKGIIALQVSKTLETYLYVHMETERSKIFIPTDGQWYPVFQGQTLGLIYNGNTTCSIGNHLHFMRADGGYIDESLFKKW
jgi:hypothetical protein